MSESSENSSKPKPIIIAFDLYGTLLSTDSISGALAKHFGKEKAQGIATEWRRLQLEYTFRLTAMQRYSPFNKVTLLALRHALSAQNPPLSLPDSDLNALLEQYNSLSVYPDVPPALSILSKSQTSPNSSESKDKPVSTYVFSNGPEHMLTASVKSSDELSPHAALFKELISVDDIETYKPSPLVYAHLLSRINSVEENLEIEYKDIWLVTSNPFDVVGASALGIKTCWVDRMSGKEGGKGWIDSLCEGLGRPVEGVESGGDGRPSVVVKGVDEAVEIIRGGKE